LQIAGVTSCTELLIVLCGEEKWAYTMGSPCDAKFDLDEQVCGYRSHKNGQFIFWAVFRPARL